MHTSFIRCLARTKSVQAKVSFGPSKTLIGHDANTLMFVRSINTLDLDIPSEILIANPSISNKDQQYMLLGLKKLCTENPTFKGIVNI